MVEPGLRFPLRVLALIVKIVFAVVAAVVSVVYHVTAVLHMDRMLRLWKDI